MTEFGGSGLHDDLYAIVGLSENHEIDPIVSALTDSPFSVLNISRAFEQYSPDHVRYADQICDEVYRLAVEALDCNDGTRPSYSTMLERLCKQIGLPVAVGDIDENESTLLNVFASRSILAVPSDGASVIVADASVAAAKAASGILSANAWSPFAASLVHFAHLRQILRDTGRLRPSSDKAVVPYPVGAHDAVVIDAENGEPFLAFATIPHGDTGWKDLQAGSALATMVLPVIEAVRPLLAGSQMLRDETLYRPILEPGAVLDKVNDAGTIWGNARKAGKYVKTQYDPVSVASLVGPTAFLALANAVVQQHKLEEIEKSLQEIKSLVQDVSKFQRSERQATLTGSVRYFQQIGFSVMSGELPPEIMHGIERHEVELLRLQDHLVEELREKIANFRNLKKEGWGSSNYINSLSDALNSIGQAYDEVCLCLRARACAYIILCAFPGREAGKKSRLNDIEEAVEMLGVSGEISTIFDKSVRDKVSVLSSYGAKGQLMNREGAILKKLASETTSIAYNIQRYGGRADTNRYQQSLEIKLRDGEPIAIRLGDLAAA